MSQRSLQSRWTDYRMLEMDLPENFIETGKAETIQIQVEGKCKISKFVFA